MAIEQAQPAICLTDVCFSYPVLGARVPGGAALSSRLGGLIRVKQGHITIDALEEISLTIHRGERIGILGHNGAGKSTLLRLMGGIYSPRSGTIECRGRVATLFDKMLGMDPELTGTDNIRVRGLFLGQTDRDIEQHRHDIIEFSELGDFIHLPVRTYSPGMRARLGFAISTCFAADILLLDEWMGVGDQRFADKARERMDAFYQQAGTVVLATHNEKLIERNCDSIVVLEKGRIIEHAPLKTQTDTSSDSVPSVVPTSPVGSIQSSTSNR